jgi:hypothetical protein
MIGPGEPAGIQDGTEEATSAEHRLSTTTLSAAQDTSEEASATSKSRSSLSRDAENEDDLTLIMATHLDMDKQEIGEVSFLKRS